MLVASIPSRCSWMILVSRSPPQCSCGSRSWFLDFLPQWQLHFQFLSKCISGLKQIIFWIVMGGSRLVGQPTRINHPTLPIDPRLATAMWWMCLCWALPSKHRWTGSRSFTRGCQPARTFCTKGSRTGGRWWKSRSPNQLLATSLILPPWWSWKVLAEPASFCGLAYGLIFTRIPWTKKSSLISWGQIWFRFESKTYCP